MKAVKEGKGSDTNSNNTNKQKNAQSSDSPGALFPRLHVRETKNVGPRAPPRNKMALYEQLTIPSHRFHQQQQQQLSGASTSSSARPTAPAAFMAPQTYQAGYYLPCYIAPPLPFQPMPMLGQNNGDMEELQRVPGLSVGDNTGQLQRLASCQSNTVVSKASSSKKSREGQEDFTVPTYQSVMTTKSVQAGKASATDSMSTALEFSQQARQAAVSNERQSTRTFDSRGRRPAGYQDTSASNFRNTVFVQNDRRQGGKMKQQQSPSNSENNGDLDNPSDEEQTGQSRRGNSEMSEGSDASVLVDGTIPKVTSRDVMNVIGERHFWEMRKAMQRQQRLFHNQVFELHRLTKVQHLLGTSGISTIEDVPPGKTLPAPSTATKPQEAAKPVPEPTQLPAPSQELTSSAPRPKPIESQLASVIAPTAPPSSVPQEYASYPAPYVFPGTNGGYPAPYVGFNGNQWFTPVPLSYPFAAPVGVYNSPYGPVLTGPGPIPFVPYPVPGDPRFNMAANNAAAAAAGMPSFCNSTQWMNYPRPVTNLAPSSSFGSTHQHPFPVAAAAPPTRKEQSISNNNNNRSYSKLVRTDTGSSAGFNLIQGAEAGRSSRGNTPQAMEVEEQSQQQEQQHQQQDSANPGLYSYFCSPAEREQRQEQQQQQHRVTKVAPKASLVTPESAAGILQSLRRQER